MAPFAVAEHSLGVPIVLKASHSFSDNNSQFQLLTNEDYKIIRPVGSGAFGVVYEARDVSNKRVALKKVVHDTRYKNREVDILKLLALHPNPHIVKLFHSFYTEEALKVCLYIVMEFIPETLSSQMKHFEKLNKTMLPDSLFQRYMEHSFKALVHLDELSICHRDIKPQNLLIDPESRTLKLGDFGSSKTISSNEANISYICSRFYRAPELVYGATRYSTAVDVWGLGCVLAEVMIGVALFPGRNQTKLLLEIYKFLGEPTSADVFAMRSPAMAKAMPKIKTRSFSEVLFIRRNKALTAQEIEFRRNVTDLLNRILVYNPERRLTASQALLHPFFQMKLSNDD